MNAPLSFYKLSIRQDSISAESVSNTCPVLTNEGWLHTEEGSSQVAVMFQSESGPLGDDCVDGVNEIGQRQIRKQSFQCDCMLMSVLHVAAEP